MKMTECYEIVARRLTNIRDFFIGQYTREQVKINNFKYLGVNINPMTCTMKSSLIIIVALCNAQDDNDQETPK